MNNNLKALIAITLVVTSLAGALAQSQATPKVKTVAVDVIAKNPKGYLGSVVVVGTVATVTPKKGFLLIDTREYKECGLSCLTEAGTKGMPVKWTGTAPKAETPVKVSGTLKKTDKGFEFVASKVEKG